MSDYANRLIVHELADGSGIVMEDTENRGTGYPFLDFITRLFGGTRGDLIEAVKRDGFGHLSGAPLSDFPLGRVLVSPEADTASAPRTAAPLQLADKITTRELADGSGFVAIDGDHPDEGYVFDYRVIRMIGLTPEEVRKIIVRDGFETAREKGMALPLDSFDLVPLPAADAISEADVDAFVAELAAAPTAEEPTR
jgi:hypothetical protein